jgi:hypothetical protein
MDRLENQLDRFNVYLDEIFAPYKIGDLMYPASEILKNCDPIAYMESLTDWLASEKRSGNHDWLDSKERESNHD